ncbi:MAG: gliding motility lipoprotein GldH [Tangfeifania sp.]
MKQNLPLFFAVIFAGMVFTSCDQTVTFDKYKAIPETGWHKDSLVVFNIPVEDTLRNHNLLINIRNETSYNYSNIWLFVEIQQPDGEMLKDTFEIALADPSGEWLGKGIGELKTREAIFRRNVRLPVPGEYTVKIQHGMRHDVLKGIHDVGFRIEKIN